jgi:primary-amine oxidase
MKRPLRTWPLLFCLLPGAAVLFVPPAGLPQGPPQTADFGEPHPLDPLTGPEIEQAARILKAAKHLPNDILFPILTLHEPAKALVLAHKAGKPFPREAFAVVYDRKTNQTHEAVVDLPAGTVKRFDRVRDVQPNILLEEFDVVQDFVRADASVRAALAKRGLTDPTKVTAELWATGFLSEPGQLAGSRLGRVIFYDNREGINSYVRPIGGLMAVVNLNTRKVVRVVDRGVVPGSDNPDNFFDPHQVGSHRSTLRPLQIDPGATPGYSVRGHEVRWQNWSFHFANHPREALVLYQVSYDDHGRKRPILYRGSLAELVVPYGDPDELWSWRAPFDEGEYGLGTLLTPLTRGKQVPDNAVLLDSVVPTGLGTARVIPGSIALYERDGGVLWQHTDPETLRLECRRARELVITCEIVAGNYDYGINWIFGQDGQLRAEVELGGIPLARAARTVKCQRCADENPKNAEDDHGTVLAPHIVAPNHQHWFCFRLDLDVDGAANTVSELSVRPASGKDGADFTLEERVLATEKGAQRDLDVASQRCWKVYNPKARTALGHYPGYVLEPGANSVPHQAAGSSVRKRAAFINHHLWVTRYKANELYPAGDYPNGSHGGQGLPEYVANDEKLAGEDVVLWYCCGVTHVPRPEDWPVMPSVRVGFRLVPHGFFTRNPALDVPAR